MSEEWRFDVPALAAAKHFLRLEYDAIGDQMVLVLEQREGDRVDGEVVRRRIISGVKLPGQQRQGWCPWGNRGGGWEVSDIYDMIMERRKLEQENLRLREALRFYANEYNWLADGDDYSEIEKDYGTKAHEALEKK